MILETFFLMDDLHAHSVPFFQDLPRSRLAKDNSKKRSHGSRRYGGEPRPRPPGVSPTPTTWIVHLADHVSYANNPIEPVTYANDSDRR